MKRHFRLLLLPLTIFVCSCSNQSGIYAGQSTNRAYEHLLDLNISYIRERDFTLFEYENRNYVMQQDKEYKHIKKIKNYEPVVPSLDDFDKLESGTDLFQIVEQYGLPCCRAENYEGFGFGFQTKEDIVKLVFFRSDMSHIYKTY